MSSTLKRVQGLFHKLNEASSENPIANVLHTKWRAFITPILPKIEELYGDDGQPVVFARQTDKSVNVACYRWTRAGSCLKSNRFQDLPAPPSPLGPSILASENHLDVDWTKVKGVIFFIHGITEHSRFTLLNMKTMTDTVALDTGRDLTKLEQTTLHNLAKLGSVSEHFAGSWVEQWVESGFVVYAPDMQGHGLSSAWEGSRCNVEHFDDLIEDTLAWIEGLHRIGEIKKGTDIFASGLSLGGCVITRALQEGFAHQRLLCFSPEMDPTAELLPVIRGALLFCPALSAERTKKKFANRVALPFGSLLSQKSPKLRLGALQKNKKFPFIEESLKHDVLIHSTFIPVRLGYETVIQLDLTRRLMKNIPMCLPFLILHSMNDTMTDPGASARVSKERDGYVELKLLQYGWHFLSKEPGRMQTCKLAIQWLDQKLNNFSTYYNEDCE